MEIKHSSPNVARPVEVHAGKRRWPWVVLIVLGVLLVIGGIIAGLYFYGGTLLNKKPAETNDQNQTNQTDDQSTDQTSGFTVADEPDADELINLVIGRFADEAGGGELKISTADATDSGELTETDVYTHEAKVDGNATALVSPNGQFVVITENQAPASGPTESLSHVISLVELSTGTETTIADNLAGAPNPVLWTPDSQHILYIVNAEEQVQSVNSYDVESGQTASTNFSVAEGSKEMLVPYKATENDLFVLRTTDDPDDATELGVLGLSDEGTIGTDFEKITDLENSNGFDVSSDGSQIILATGSAGDGDGPLDGPFMLELLTRSTGEIQELRTSASEEYGNPLFTRDGEAIVYSALSGIWMLDLDSEDRTQLVETSEFEGLSGNLVPTPVAISPNDELLTFYTPAARDVVKTYFVVNLTDELVALDDLAQVEPLDAEDEGSIDVFGWTI